MKPQLKLGALFALVLLLGSPPNNCWAKSIKRDMAQGRITKISSNLLRVGTIAVRLTSSTQFENSFGDAISLSMLEVGDCVKVKMVRSASVLTAREVELTSHCKTVRSKNEDRSSGQVVRRGETEFELEHKGGVDDNASNSSNSSDTSADDSDAEKDSRRNRRGRR